MASSSASSSNAGRKQLTPSRQNDLFPTTSGQTTTERNAIASRAGRKNPSVGVRDKEAHPGLVDCLEKLLALIEAVQNPDPASRAVQAASQAFGPGQATSCRRSRGRTGGPRMGPARGATPGRWHSVWSAMGRCTCRLQQRHRSPRDSRRCGRLDSAASRFLGSSAWRTCWMMLRMGMRAVPSLALGQQRPRHALRGTGHRRGTDPAGEPRCSGQPNHGFVSSHRDAVRELRHRVEARMRTDVLEVVPGLEVSSGEVPEIAEEQDGASIVRCGPRTSAPDHDLGRASERQPCGQRFHVPRGSLPIARTVARDERAELRTPGWRARLKRWLLRRRPTA